MFENTKGVVMLPSVRDFVGQNGCFWVTFHVDIRYNPGQH